MNTEMSIVEDFLVEAKINTYAGGGTLSDSSRPNSKDMHYSKGKYQYIDTYLGGINFIGEEAVYYEEKAVWGMNYYGEMLKGEGVPPGFSKCLKSALRAVPKEAPYRGPKIYDDGDFQYRCRWYGSVESFHGEEYISYKNTDIYKLRFHGGIIS